MTAVLRETRAEYTGTDVASEQEVKELAAEAHHFADLMQEMIRQRHPHLAKRH